MSKKLTAKEEILICKNYPKFTLQELAAQYKVHPSTVSRVLGKYNKRKPLTIKSIVIDDESKMELRKTLLGLGISDPNSVVSALEKKFRIKLYKEANVIQIFNVEEWEC